MKKNRIEFYRFFAVGFAAFLLDFGILNTLVYVFDFKAELFNFVLVANIVSTVCAILFGFYFQKRWTFKIIERNKTKTEFALFMVLQSFNLLFYNALVFNLLIKGLGLSIPLSKVLTISIQTFSSYFAMKYLVFKTGLAKQ